MPAIRSSNDSLTSQRLLPQTTPTKTDRRIPIEAGAGCAVEATTSSAVLCRSMILRA